MPRMTACGGRWEGGDGDSMGDKGVEVIAENRAGGCGRPQGKGHLCLVDIELRAREVVEEEQRLGPGNHYIIHRLRKRALGEELRAA